MNQFSLEILFHIVGIGSASGLFYADNSIYLISDNGNNLYEYNMASGALGKIPLVESNTTENIPKISKPDFEAIAQYGDTLYIFGSGSTHHRNNMVQFDLKTKSVISTTDLTGLYAVMQSFGKISPADFNIEGVVYDGESWYFFQRGNAGTGTNGVFTVSGEIIKNDFSILYNPYKLPKIKGIETSFTDAVLVNETLFFLATAEDTKTAYDDGDVLGSIIGTLSTKTMKIGKTKNISDAHKLEGITVFENSDQSITFLLCEDNDSDLLQSDIFRLTIKK